MQFFLEILAPGEPFAVNLLKTIKTGLKVKRPRKIDEIARTFRKDKTKQRKTRWYIRIMIDRIIKPVSLRLLDCV